MMDDMEGSSRQEKKFDPLPDYHLQNPLYDLQEKFSKWKSRSRLPVRVHKSFLSFSENFNNLIEGDPILLRQMISKLGGHLIVEAPVTVLRDVRQRLSLDLSLSEKIDTKILSEAFSHLTRNFPIRSWSLMRNTQDMLIALNALSSRRPVPSGWQRMSQHLYVRQRDPFKFWITPSFLGVSSPGENHVTIFDGDWLRSVSDLFTERFLVRAAIILGRNINPMHYPDREIIEKIIMWGDAVLDTEGNEGFKLLKAYEAIVLGVLQTKSAGNFVDNDKFLSNTLSDLSDESIRFGVQAEELSSILKELESPHHLTQLYGLHRIWGHPLVDPLKGMLKMLKIGQKDIIEEGLLPLQLGVHFKKMFAESFRAKNGVYPKIKTGNTELHNLMSKNEDWAKISSPDLEELWEGLHFDKNYSIPESFNLSMIVADKSVSPTLSELKNNVLTRGSVMNAELRRGVLRWINNDAIDPREFLTDVSKGKFPHDHKIIGLRSKERELNPTPRMFALMSHLMRVYVVVTESMLSEHILPHFPQITMTDDLLSLTKKTYSTVKGQSKYKQRAKFRASRTVCISLDFDKWNGHMRQEGTLYVFKELGNLFGLEDLYHVTYDIFKESYFYLADGSYVPKVDADGSFVPEPPASFTGHKGGQEGLRQKGWTIFTVVGLDMICSRHNVSYKIMGMGDNQVLLLTLYTNKVDGIGSATTEGVRDMRRILNNVFNDLLETFNSLGLPLKPLETWTSEDLFVYGKYPVWQGVPLSMDIKKIMRIFPFSNQEMMTTENILNTIAGNAQAATQGSPALGLSYVIGLFMLSLSIDDLLTYHPLLGQGLMSVIKEDQSWAITIGKRKPIRIPIDCSRMSRTLIRRLMMIVPRILGGYVTFSIYGLLMRGFPDPLTLSLSQLFDYKFNVDSSGGPLEKAVLNWISPIYMPDKSFKMLLEDVSSINVLAPVTPTAGLRREVENYLSSTRVIKNKEFRGLMKCKDEELEEILAEGLCSGVDLHIRLLHDILESTIFGYVRSIISKVTKSSTILSLAVDKSRGDPLARVIENEANYFKFFLWRSNKRGPNQIPDCPTDLAKMTRKTGWGKNLIGVTVAFPFSYLKRTDCHLSSKTCDCEDGYISLFLSDSMVSKSDWNYAIGGNPPYLGSMTKEKLVIASGSRIYSGEPLVRRPISLMRVIGWFVPDDSNTANVIRSCVSAVSDINPNQFKGISEGSSGSEIHRYKDTSLKHGALCSSNYLYSTRYHVSTDTFTRYAKGSQNFDMMFQANLCSIVESTHLEVIRNNLEDTMMPKFYHFKQCCYHCIQPLDETFHDVASSSIARLIPTNKSNPYLYVPEDKISMNTYTAPFPGWIDSSLSEDDCNRITDRDKMRVLSECLVDNIVIDITSASTEVTHITSALLDIKEHNRLFYLTVSPRDIYIDLCYRIIMLGEWRCLNLQEWKIPTDDAVLRSCEALLSSLALDKLAGMAGFFTWPESMERYYFSPEIVEPDTIPVTVESACRSIKMSLINLVNAKFKTRSYRETHILLEETKASKLTLKMMIYDHISRKTDRWCCRRAIARLSPHELSSVTPELILCHQNHVLFPMGSKGLILQARMSMDSLKKRIDLSGLDRGANMLRASYSALDRTSCQIAYSSYRTRAKGLTRIRSADNVLLSIVPVMNADLYKICSLPTNAQYKYLEILSYMIGDIQMRRHCFLLGNGLGGSSLVLGSLWGGEITTSTLLNPEDCIQQAYPNSGKAHIFSHNSKTDCTSMISAVNDVLNKSWESSWNVLLNKRADWFLSDIEINDQAASLKRDTVLEKISKLRRWSLGIFKDYIYSKQELENRLSISLRHYTGVRLLTCGSRQRVMPEVWWILKNRREDPVMSDMCYIRDELDIIWDNLQQMINYADPMLPKILTDCNLRLANKQVWEGMMGRVRNWASMPIVGSFLPHNKSYTRLLGYIQRGKRPIDIKEDPSDKGRKLYVSDYMKMREILFGLAVSMVSDISDRSKMLDESAYWIMDWHTDIGGTWIPFLKKTDHQRDKIHVYDYIPILTVLMSKNHLLFREIGDLIKFKPDKERKTLCFPITRAAYIKYSSFELIN
nr:TPA_asm: L [Morinda alphacytorhabdovirus 1_Mor]